MNWIRSLGVLVETIHARRRDHAQAAREKLKDRNARLAERKAEPDNADKPPAVGNNPIRLKWIPSCTGVTKHRAPAAVRCPGRTRR